MLQREMSDLMGMKNILIINDEAHHCYREKPDADDEDLKGDDKKTAEKSNEAARVWKSGLEAVKHGLSRVIDLSATPSFLRGFGCADGTLFPWTMSDFSLMDAIERGIANRRASLWRKTTLATLCRCFATFGRTFARTCPRKGAGVQDRLAERAEGRRL